MKPTTKKSKYIAVSCTLLVFFLFGCTSILFPSLVKKITSSSLPVEILWQAEIEEAVDGKPVITDEAVIIRTDKAIYVLDIKTGQLIWKHLFEKYQATKTSMSVKNGKIIYGNRQGQVVALDLKTGDVIWRNKFPGGSKEINSVGVCYDTVYAVSQPTAIGSFDLDTGEFIWYVGPDHSIPSRGGYHFCHNDELYVITTKVHILDAETGEIKQVLEENISPSQLRDDKFYSGQWVRDVDTLELISTLEAPSRRFLGGSCEYFVPPYTFSEDQFYGVGYCGGVYALDREDNQIHWEYRPEVLAQSPVAIYHDNLYVLFNDGEIHAIDPQTGEEQGILKTNFRLQEYLTSSIGSVANETILVVTFGDKDVWAFCEKPCSLVN